ncbi:6-pyruvoyl trahydropterin synthase family protein [Coprococcus sp. B2-R-112]|uniref:6-pyruvoyl trahydropterin synthase family protein n=1 Tax=Coprococcus sp. B2-R-112 TaxID=2949662 RepID=UPI002030F1A7|nr:6-carboxytetrahydropterin synthase [Coprococcus sp. B2-R-112]MCM0662266.1 6-carboxytetrahydropterin synthase [Coprococcus sp. B2-R-112]
MYYLKTEHSFDSAHFLAGYEGKCCNIHGHEWRVVIEICRPDLDEEGQTRDMMFDFGQLKKDVKREVDAMDHALIIEKGSLMPATMAALQAENFRIIEIPYRPTAERLAYYFYERLTACGYHVHRSTVYEAPNNCASYEE